MRYPASEKLEIIRLVEESALPVRRMRGRDRRTDRHYRFRFERCADAASPLMKEDVRVRNLAKPTLADVHKIFGTWFGDDYDLDVIDVVLAIAATAKFDGDPAWLQIVGGSGEAKTETVTAPPLHSG